MPIGLGAGYAMGAGINAAAGLFGNRGGATQEQSQLWELLMSMRGKQALTDQDITGIIPFVQRGAAGATNRVAQSASQRLGLESGAAQGEIARASLDPIYQMLAQLKGDQPQINARYDQNILRMLTQLAG